MTQHVGRGMLVHCKNMLQVLQQSDDFNVFGQEINVSTRVYAHEYGF